MCEDRPGAGSFLDQGALAQPIMRFAAAGAKRACLSTLCEPTWERPIDVLAATQSPDILNAPAGVAELADAQD